MFGRKRVTTGLGNEVVDSITTSANYGSSAIGFNFEAVGNMINGKTVIVKLHKIRYSPLIFSDSAENIRGRNVWLAVNNFVTALDVEFPAVDYDQYRRFFFDNQSCFGIDNTTQFTLGGDTVYPGQMLQAITKTVEVNLDVLLPFININACSYYGIYVGNLDPNFPLVVSYQFGAELTWSYELVSPQEYQALKMDWQGKLLTQSVPGNSVFN